MHSPHPLTTVAGTPFFYFPGGGPGGGTAGAKTFHIGAGLRVTLYSTKSQEARAKFVLPRTRADKQQHASQSSGQLGFTDADAAMQYTMYLANERDDFAKQLLAMPSTPDALFQQATKLEANQAASKRQGGFNGKLVGSPLAVCWLLFVVITARP